MTQTGWKVIVGVCLALAAVGLIVFFAGLGTYATSKTFYGSENWLLALFVAILFLCCVGAIAFGKIKQEPDPHNSERRTLK